MTRPVAGRGQAQGWPEWRRLVEPAKVRLRDASSCPNQRGSEGERYRLLTISPPTTAITSTVVPAATTRLPPPRVPPMTAIPTPRTAARKKLNIFSRYRTRPEVLRFSSAPDTAPARPDLALHDAKQTPGSHRIGGDRRVRPGGGVEPGRGLIRAPATNGQRPARTPSGCPSRPPLREGRPDLGGPRSGREVAGDGRRADPGLVSPLFPSPAASESWHGYPTACDPAERSLL